MEQIEALQDVNFYVVDGWKKFLTNSKKREIFTEFNISLIRNNSTYLAMVYYMSLQYYNAIPYFETIIEMAMNRVNDAHLADYTPHLQTMQIELHHLQYPSYL